MKPCAHLKKPSTNSVGNWSAEEDEAILRYVYSKEQTGDSMMWGNLQHSLNGRSGKSCRERWFNHLDPKIKRCDWTVEEQWVLFILRNQQNEKWSLISKILLGRTDNAVKNYWNSRLRKRIDNMQKAYEQHFERKKKQKILTYLESSGWNEQTNIQEKTKRMNDKEDMSKQTLTELEKNLNEAQQKELKETMEKLKADYLHKMIEQIEKQNIEYYNELACEYELQMQKLKEVSGTSLFNNQTQMQNDGGLDIGSPRFQEQSKEDNRQSEFITDEQQFNSQMNQQSTLSNIGISTQQDQLDSNFQGIAQENPKSVQQQDFTRNKIGGFESFSSDQIDDAVEIFEDALPEKFVTKERSPYKNGAALKGDNLNLGIPECEEEDYESQLSQLYIFRSTATLKMHLEILYKSVGFLNRKQIMSELIKYKEGKEKEQMRLKEIRREQEDAIGRRRGRKKEVKDFDTSPYAGLKLGIRKGSASHEIYQSIDDDVEMEEEEDTESEEDESDEIEEETVKKQTKQKQELIHDFKKKSKKGEEIPDLSKLSEKKKNQTNFSLKKNVSFPNKKSINNLATSNKFQDNDKGHESNVLFEGPLKRSDILSRNKTGKNGATQTGISGDLVKTRSDNFHSHEANGPVDTLKHQREQEDIYLVLSGSDSDASQNYRKGKNRQAGSGELKRTLNGLDNYDSDSSDSLSSLRSKVSKHSKLSCQTNQALKKIKKQKKKSKYIQKIFLTEKLQKNHLGKDPLIQNGKVQPINEQEKIYQISCFTPQPYREMYPREYGQISAFAGYNNQNQVPNFQPQNSWAPPVMNQQIQDKNNAFAMFQNQHHQQLQMLPPDQRLEYPSPSLSTRMNDLNLVTPHTQKNQGFVAHINPNATNFLGGPNQQGAELKNISSVSFGPNQGQTNQNHIYMNQERNSPHDISYMFNNNFQTNLSGLSFNNSSNLQGQNNSKLAGFFSQQRIDNRNSGQYSQNTDSNEIIKSSKNQNERVISAKYSKMTQNNLKYHKPSQSKKVIEKAFAHFNAANSKHNTPQISIAKQRVIMEGTNESLFYQDKDEKINKEIGQDLDSRFMTKSKSARQIPQQIGYYENLWQLSNFQTLNNEQKLPQEQLKIEGQNGHISNIESQFRASNFTSNAFQVREQSSNGRIQTPLSGLNQVPHLQHVHNQNPMMMQRGNSMNQPWQSQNSSDSVLSFSQNFQNMNHIKQPTLDRQIQSMYTGPSTSLIGYNPNQLVNYGQINQNGGSALANLHPSQQYGQNNNYLNSQQQNQFIYQQQQVDYPYRNNPQIQYVNQAVGQGQQIQLIEQQSPFIRSTHSIQSGIQTSVTQGTTGFQSWMNATGKERVLTRAGVATDPNIKNQEFEANKMPQLGNTQTASIKDIRNPSGVDQQFGYHNSQAQNFQKINQFQNISQVNDVSFAQAQPMMLNNGSNPEMNLQQVNYNNNVMYVTQQNQFVKNNNQLGQNSAFIPGQHHIHQINIQPGLSIISSQDSQAQLYGQIQNQHNQQQQQIIGSSYDKNSIGVNGTQSHENTGSQDYKIAISGINSGINKNKNDNSHGHSDNLNTRDQQDEHLIERIEENQNELSHAQGQNTFLHTDEISQTQVGKSEKRIFHTNNIFNSTTAQLSKLQKTDNFRQSSISNCKLMYNSMTGGRRGQSQARQSKQLLGSHTEINPDYNEMLSPDVTSGSDTRLSVQNYERNAGSGGQNMSNQIIPGINLNSAKKNIITPFSKLTEGRTSNF